MHVSSLPGRREAKGVCEQFTGRREAKGVCEQFTWKT